MPAAAGSGKSKTQFRHEFDHMARLYDQVKGPRSERVSIPFVLSKLPDRRARALDIGCGTGRLVRHLSGAFNKVVGVDMSLGMLEMARQLNATSPNVHLVEMDAEKLGFEDDTFDFVVGIEVLHHINPAIGVEEAMRVTRPEGRLLIMEPLARQGNGAQLSAYRRWRLWAGQMWRLIGQLGVRDSIGWMKAWADHTVGEKMLTSGDWDGLANLVPGCQAMMFRWYAYLLWDKPASPKPARAPEREAEGTGFPVG